MGAQDSRERRLALGCLALGKRHLRAGSLVDTSGTFRGGGRGAIWEKAASEPVGSQVHRYAHQPRTRAVDVLGTKAKGTWCAKP